MKIMIVGGTGFLGYHAMLVALKRGHSLNALAIDDVVLGDWYPVEVNVQFGDVFELTGEDLHTVGDENHSYNEMLEMMMSAIGERKKIVNIPRFLAVLAGIMIEKRFKKKGLEGGLDGKYLMRDIITHDLYYDASETAEKLGYKRGGLNKAIAATMKACYPEKFKD